MNTPRITDEDILRAVYEAEIDPECGYISAPAVQDKLNPGRSIGDMITVTDVLCRLRMLVDEGRLIFNHDCLKGGMGYRIKRPRGERTRL